MVCKCNNIYSIFFFFFSECSIVLDLMHSLIDTIRTHDTSKQQEIMLQKYHLLTSKIDLNDTMVHVERCRKAINNGETFLADDL